MNKQVIDLDKLSKSYSKEYCINITIHKFVCYTDCIRLYLQKKYIKVTQLILMN